MPRDHPDHRDHRDHSGHSGHRTLTAHVHAVPKPFRSFAVRSDEPAHAWHARSPYGLVHVVRTGFLDPAASAALAAQGYANVDVTEPGAVDYASTSPQALAAAVPQVSNLVQHIASALCVTGVLGGDPAAYLHSVQARLDYLASRGAGFHNDVRGRWSRSLFWVLALDLHDVEFVMPHAGVRLPLAPGDLLVFDQTMAHGLCRPGDHGQAVAASFGDGDAHRQLFLTGELALDDAQWAALGAPWLPVEHHQQQGALDLMVAEFDDRSGAIKQVRTLAHCMQRSVCHVGVADG